MWHVRERFIELQNAGVEPVVQFPHAIRAMDHAQKDSRRAGNEAFHIAQADLEGLDVGTTVGNQLQGLAFGPGQGPRRKHGDVRPIQRIARVELVAQPGDEFCEGSVNVRDQSVFQGRHL